MREKLKWVGRDDESKNKSEARQVRSCSRAPSWPLSTSPRLSTELQPAAPCDTHSSSLPFTPLSRLRRPPDLPARVLSLNSVVPCYRAPKASHVAEGRSGTDFAIFRQSGMAVRREGRLGFQRRHAELRRSLAQLLLLLTLLG